MERLWHFEQITGYRRNEGRFWFYSKDGLWWNGVKLPFDHSDPQFYLKDKNNRSLYHRDLIRIRDVAVRKLILLEEGWRLIDPFDSSVSSPELIENKKLEFLAVGGDNLEYDRILIAQLKPLQPKLVKS